MSKASPEVLEHNHQPLCIISKVRLLSISLLYKRRKKNQLLRFRLEKFVFWE